MQTTVLKRPGGVWVPDGSGPKLGTAERTAIALLSGGAPISLHIDGLLREDVARATEGLFRFDAETPRETQKLWEVHVPRDPDYDEPDDGVIRKDGIDQKIYLHWRPDLEVLLHERGITLTGEQEEWFAHCARIHAACCRSLLEVTLRMDHMRPGYHFAERIRGAMDQHCLRILKYYRREKPGPLARTHTDRNGITFGIDASADGFCAQLGWDTVPCPAPALPQVICFSGSQLEKITEGAVRALHHKVVDIHNGTRERSAMVFFGKMPKDTGMY